MNHHDLVPAGAESRRPYQPPSLRVFGKVSTLTQAASGCNSSDNPGCGTSPPFNMGPIPHLRR
jgi:hypothetical protein